VKNPKAIRDSWNSAYGGYSNANRVAILEEGMKFELIAIPNNEAQFLETRKFQVNEICRIFRISPHLVGNLEYVTFFNIEHMSIDFAAHTIRPPARSYRAGYEPRSLHRSGEGAFLCAV